MYPYLTGYHPQVYWTGCRQMVLSIPGHVISGIFFSVLVRDLIFNNISYNNRGGDNNRFI